MTRIAFGLIFEHNIPAIPRDSIMHKPCGIITIPARVAVYPKRFWTYTGVSTNKDIIEKKVMKVTIVPELKEMFLKTLRSMMGLLIESSRITRRTSDTTHIMLKMSIKLEENQSSRCPL